MPCFHSRRDPNRALHGTRNEINNDPYRTINKGSALS